MQHDEELRIPRAVPAAAEVAFICDEPGSVLEASATIRDLLGLSIESVRGQPFVRLAIRGDERAVRRGLSEASHGGASSFSVRLRAEHGRRVQVKISAWSVEVLGKRLTVCLAAASSDARRQAEERARRLADTQKVIGTVLENALEEIPVEELLRRTLDLILWIPWLSIERKGAIFLVEDPPDALVMKVHRGLDGPLLSTCARVSFGSCLCGQAAASRTPVFAENLDERHTTLYPGIAAHGHYCVPICSGGATLGVITTYLAPGHEPSAIDLEFLMAVADTLAGVLMRRRADAECRGLQRRLNEMLQRERLLCRAAPAAHELGDLLNVFLTSAQELLQRLPAKDGLRATAEAIERAAQRGMVLTSQLQALGREESTRPDPVAVVGVARDSGP